MARHEHPPGYHDVLDDLERPGCPVCQTTRREAEHSLDTLLYESVSDPGMRERLRASHGFCTDHALLALQLAARTADGQAIGVLYSDLLDHIARDARRATTARARSPWRRRRSTSDPLRPTAPCPICESMQARADRYLLLLAQASADEEIGVAVRRADRGICAPHLVRGLELTTRREHADQLLELFLQAESQIREDVAEYLRKLDHRFADEPLGREQRSWQRALLWVTGLPSHTTATTGRDR